eukprot:648762-Amphidinium_carterae.1
MLGGEGSGVTKVYIRQPVCCRQERIANALSRVDLGAVAIFFPCPKVTEAVCDTDFLERHVLEHVLTVSQYPRSTSR